MENISRNDHYVHDSDNDQLKHLWQITIEELNISDKEITIKQLSICLKIKHTFNNSCIVFYPKYVVHNQSELSFMVSSNLCKYIYWIQWSTKDNRTKVKLSCQNPLSHYIGHRCDFVKVFRTVALIKVHSFWCIHFGAFISLTANI